MKAVLFDRYGSPDVLELREIDKPRINEDEVLVRIRAASVNPYDWHFLTGKPYIMRVMVSGLFKPKFHRLGGDLAGEVEAVGGNVTRFRVGDAVFGSVNGAVPDQPMLDLGSFAEYVRVAEDHLALKPAKLTFEEAAAVPLAALTALNGLRTPGPPEPGRRVLINGASGGVGTFAVQIAKSLGAEVTGVCSTRNVGLVESIGADQVIDYTQHDFTRSGVRHDLVFDLVGNRSLRECMRVLNPDGVYLMCFGRPEHDWLGPFRQLVGARLISPFIKPKLVELTWHLRSEDLESLRELLVSGTVTPVIDRSYALSEAADAVRYLEKGHARGKVVISV
ncbi:MAG: NAD(P)-dependent alcohol dehydrogenase [Longimicrobiales bacterium]